MSTILQVAERLIEEGAEGAWEELKKLYNKLHGDIALDEADWKEVEAKVNAQPEPAEPGTKTTDTADNKADAASPDAKAATSKK